MLFLPPVPGALPSISFRYDFRLTSPLSTVLSANVNRAQGVFIEMFITAALCLAVLMLAAEKHSSTPFAPVCVVSLLPAPRNSVRPESKTDGPVSEPPMGKKTQIGVGLTLFACHL